MSDAARELVVRAYRGDTFEARADRVAHEEPLEIQLGGVSIAVVMRTPGHDEELVTGFLASERVVEHAADIASIRHCTVVTEPEAEDNVVRVVLREGLTAPLARLSRNLFASSSCGVCGKATIEAALTTGAALTGGPTFTARAIYAMPEALRAAQRAFDETGGLHAAGLFSEGGQLLFSREDVGRHNAVDKIIGAALRAGIDLGRTAVFVSGRTSFEIVQKAANTGIRVVAGISAPTSLAVRYGEALGVTVAAFVRGERMNVYAHPERIAS